MMSERQTTAETKAALIKTFLDATLNLKLFWHMASCVKTTSIACDIIKTSQEKDIPKKLG